MEELRKMTDQKLVHHELQLERELIVSRFRKATGQVEDTSQLSGLRKDIARVRTIERQRELEQGLGKNALRQQHRPSFKPGSVDSAGDGASGGFLKGIVDKIGNKD
ncbi:MAG: 50S ribosomal protein L29 [Myxococcota bacterium]|nr:50S ribosomal protein L29 [Myxococcota bacterium]